MKSLANKAVASAYDKLGKINDLLNGPDPRFVSYRENGKDKKIENLDLSSEHCRSFIGKMKIDGKGTYSDDVITALLKYFFDHTKKGEKVVIELANKVSEIMNGEESMEGNMKYEDQRQHILELAKDLNKKRLNDLEIMDIEDNNTRLFDVLKNEGIKGLESEGMKMSLGEKFDSLDIARILYSVAKQDKNYLEEIRDLKGEELKKIEGDSDYYGLIEMAIRINALLHGITLQGGVARQKKYDALLLKHINPYVKDFPLLEPFQKFCWEYLKGETFKGLYFDTKESELLVNKIDAKNQLLSKTKNALSIALGTGILTSSILAGNRYLQSQKQKKATQETIKEIFENKKVTWSGEYGRGEYKGKEKLEQIDKYTQKIYDRFIFRYGSIGEFGEKEFKSKIIDCLNNQKLLSDFGSEFSNDKIALEDIIIDDYLIPQNIGEFKMNKVSISPYESLVPYTDEFINTILLEKDFEVREDSTNKAFDGKWGVKVLNSPIMKDIGGFTPKNIGGQFSFFKNRFALVSHKGKQYIVASPSYVDKLDDDYVNIYSTSKARDLAVDFLEQTNPILNLLIDQYMIRYFRREQPGLYTSEGPAKATIDSNTELRLIRGFLKGGFLQKIGRDFNMANKLEKITRINEFLDDFVIKNKSMFKNEMNPNLIPNGFFSEYEDAMENIISEEDGVLNNIGRLPLTDWGKNNTVKHIGKYQTSDGKRYNVGFVEIKGKRYLYADEEGSPNYGNMTYGTYEGGVVARDYLKQTSPVAKELIDLFFRRYYGGQKPNEIFDNIEDLLINDFVKQGSWKNLDKDYGTEKNTRFLLGYLDEFAIRNMDTFKHRSKYSYNNLNKDMIPNNFLKGYEGAMRNTIVNKDKIYVSGYLSAADRLFGNIGKYISSDGKKYSIWESDVNGKSYLCAEEEGKKTDDVLACGKIVAEDYLKTTYK